MTEASVIEELGWAAIAQSQPNGKIPMWLLRNVTTNKTNLGNGLWELMVYLFKKKQLSTNESWERGSDGSKTLVRTEPDSGERKYALSYIVDERDRVDIFRVQVDTNTKISSVKEAVDVSALDQNLFELYYEDPDGH